jgi:hypothetical protein
MNAVVRRVACIIGAWMLFASPSLGADADKDDDIPIAVHLNDIEWMTEIASAPVMPGESLTIEVRDPAARRWVLAAPVGRSTRVTPRRWTWQAPQEPGIVEAHLIAAGEEDPSTKLKLLVMVPAARVTNTGRLNGYQIGAYPAKPLNGNPLYLPPRGFIEVTDDNDDELLSPHFRLGQFTSKQSKDFPKYVVIDPRLLVRLEWLASRLDDLDLPSKLHVMSGYRTPFYNRVLGNVQYSLHQWGVAADVFVDENEDGTMDDLNQDKRIDRDDATALFKVANGLDRRNGGPAAFAGGLGIYGSNSAHGPFVHIDVRGRAARW